MGAHGARPDSAQVAHPRENGILLRPSHLLTQGSAVDGRRFPASHRHHGRWTSSKEIRGTTFYLLRTPWGPAQTQHLTVICQRRLQMTCHWKSAEVSSSVGVTIGFLEAQLGAKL